MKASALTVCFFSMLLCHGHTLDIKETKEFFENDSNGKYK